MSQYRWYVRHATIGVINADGALLGVVHRSGWCSASGHFCSVRVSVNGRMMHASGAEDRTYGFHSIALARGDAVPALDLEAVGWTSDGNDLVFCRPGGDELVYVDGTPVPAARRPLRPHKILRCGWKTGGNGKTGFRTIYHRLLQSA
jgi:hypothetical protein